MIGNPPAFPQRHYFDYTTQDVAVLGDLLKRRNPFAQSSVSALKDTDTCIRMGFLKSVVGLSTPQHPAAAEGEVMHKENETWHKGGPLPPHPSLQAAIAAELLPKPAPHVKAEQLFFLPTGVRTPTSPDGQLWLKGKIDLVEEFEDRIEITDMKSKGNVNACTTYALTPEQMLKDFQMGLYGHVYADVVNKTVAHLYMVRDRTMPFARLVKVALTQDVARRTYLRLLKVAEIAVEYSQCGDWRAVPGNFGKCEKPFKCPFVPLCHGKQNGETVIDMVNPRANDPVAITPPDAAEPLGSPGPGGVAPEKQKKKRAGAAPAISKEQVAVMVTDFDEILNLATNGGVKAPVTPPPQKPAEKPPEEKKSETPAAAVTVKSTPVPQSTQPPAAAEGVNDAAGLDAMLGGLSKVKPVKPATAAVTPPATQVAASVTPVTPPVVTKVETPVFTKVEPLAPPPPVVTPITPPVTNPTLVGGLTVEMSENKSIGLLIVGAMSPDLEAVSMADLVRKSEKLVVERHNKRPGVSHIHSMYQLDHGGWRGDFAAIIRAVVKDAAPTVVYAVGSSPAMDAALEAVDDMAEFRFYPTR